MSRQGYNAVAVTGAKERCSSCELLNILGKPKYGQKRCKQCIEKQNKRQMRLKHIPVHLRKRNLGEQTEKAGRILSEQTADEPGPDNNDGRDFLVAGSRRNADEEEQVKLSDILEITFELLDLVEAHVSRNGSIEEVARFENQLKVLRKGRDTVKSQAGHLEDRRAIILAFSIFTENYTVLVRDHEKLLKKNQALKQLAYDTAGLVKKSEGQFDSYVAELKSLQGHSASATQMTKIELTKLRSEITGLKLELNLRTNELREMQLETSAQAEQASRERDRAEEARKDKDSRITSLLAQLQQLSLDFAHEKSERLRLERENERLWTDRMAYRSEQIRSKHLSAAERTLAAERDATEKREWLEWKKKSALREVASKERMRTEAWEVRRSVETDAAATMDKIRRELGSDLAQAQPVEDPRPSTVYGRTKEQRATDRETTRRAQLDEERDGEWWMANEERPGSNLNVPASRFPTDLSPISSLNTANANAQRWHARMERQNEEELIDQQIEQLRNANAQTKARSATQPTAARYSSESPPSDIIRAGNYSGGVESVLNNPRTSPALPYFSDPPSNTLTWQIPPAQQSNSRPANNYTSTNFHPQSIAYQPTSVASAIPPPVAQYAPVAEAAPPVPSEGSAERVMAEQIREVQRQIDEMQKANERKANTVIETAVAQSSRPSSAASRHAPSSSADYDAIEDGLRRSRQVRGENARITRTSTNNSHPLTGDSTSSRRQHCSSNNREEHRRPRSDDDDFEDDRRDRKHSRPSSRSARSGSSASTTSSRSRSRSASRDGDRERERERASSSRRQRDREAEEAIQARRRSDRRRDERERRDRDATSEDEEEDRRAHSRNRSTDSRGRVSSRTIQPSDLGTAVPVRNLTLYAVNSK